MVDRLHEAPTPSGYKPEVTAMKAILHLVWNEHHRGKKQLMDRIRREVRLTIVGTRETGPAAQVPHSDADLKSLANSLRDNAQKAMHEQFAHEFHIRAYELMHTYTMPCCTYRPQRISVNPHDDQQIICVCCSRVVVQFTIPWEQLHRLAEDDDFDMFGAVELVEYDTPIDNAPTQSPDTFRRGHAAVQPISDAGTA